MKILHISDLHGKIDNLARLKQVAQTCDLLAVSGDLSHFGRAKKIKSVCQALPTMPTVAVLGNCDYPNGQEALQEADIDLEQTLKNFGGLRFWGKGGSLAGPGPTPNLYSEEELEQVLLSAQPADIWICHQPPYGCLADRLDGGLHVGSQVLRKQIERLQPRLILCGHIHEAQSQSQIGTTTVVNSGSLAMGEAALIELTPNQIDCKLLQI